MFIEYFWWNCFYWNNFWWKLNKGFSYLFFCTFYCRTMIYKRRLALPYILLCIIIWDCVMSGKAVQYWLGRKFSKHGLWAEHITIGLRLVRSPVSRVFPVVALYFSGWKWGYVGGENSFCNQHCIASATIYPIVTYKQANAAHFE